MMNYNNMWNSQMNPNLGGLGGVQSMINNNENCGCQMIQANSKTMDKCKCNCTFEFEQKNQCEENEEMTREEMAKQLKCYRFAIIELGLYLDTHPDDEKAICLHKEYCNKFEDLADKYQRIYGPLTIMFPCNKWRWLEEPWPWERGNF